MPSGDYFRELTKEEILFDKGFYHKVRQLREVVAKNRDMDEAIALWKEGAAFIREHFIQIKNGEKRHHYCDLPDGGRVYFTMMVNSIHFFITTIVNLLTDDGRFEDAYGIYFFIVNELQKSPDVDGDFFDGGAWHYKWSASEMVLSKKRKKFQLHNLFKEIARNIKFHGKSLGDYPFIDPKYHEQIMKIRVRTPRLKHPLTKVTVEKQTTVGDLLTQLKIPSGKHLAVLVDGKKADLDEQVNEGQKVIILPMIAGG